MKPKRYSNNKLLYWFSTENEYSISLQFFFLLQLICLSLFKLIYYPMQIKKTENDGFFIINLLKICVVSFCFSLCQIGHTQENYNMAFLSLAISFYFNRVAVSLLCCVCFCVVFVPLFFRVRWSSVSWLDGSLQFFFRFVHIVVLYALISHTLTHAR